MRGEEPGDAERREDERRGREAAPGQQPEAGSDEQRDADDEELEGELVVGPEQPDDDLLRAGRLEVDHELSDGGDQRGRAGEEAGEQLRDPEGDRGRGDPGDGGSNGGEGGVRRGGHGTAARWHRSWVDRAGCV